MTGFTDDEIQTAVEQLVQSTIRKPYDTLGTRRTDVSFSDIQQAAAGVFLLYPKAPFYCLYLGSQRVLTNIASEAAILDALLSAIRAVGRSVLPVTDISPLFNAKAALESLGQAALTRTSSFKDITALPAYQRFAQNIDRFLSQSGSAIKEGGQVVQTPLEAQQALPGLVQQLRAAHLELVQSVVDLSNGADDYNGLNLSAIVAQSVIANATTVLGNHASELQALQPGERLASIRKVVLDLIASKSVVTKFGSFGGSTDFFSVVGTGIPYADSSHPAIPATVTASVAAPYNTQSKNYILDLFLDGAGIPRSATIVISIFPLSYFQAQFTLGAPAADVSVGDVIYVLGGPNAGTRWVVLSISGTVLTAQGQVAAFNDGIQSVEVFAQPSTTVSLPFAYSAQLNGIVSEQVYSTGTGFIIGDGTHPTRPASSPPAPTNNILKVNVGGTIVTCPLTLSADGSATTEATPRTAQQICDDINGVLAAHNYKAVPYLAPRRFYGKVLETAVSPTSAQFAAVGGFTNFSNLGVVVGDVVNVLDGSGTQLGLWSVTAVGGTTLTCAPAAGQVATTQTTGVTIEIGPAQRRIRIQAVDPHLSVQNLDVINVVDDGGASTGAGQTLGIAAGGTSRSRPQTAKDVALGVNQGTTLASATTAFTADLVGAPARSQPGVANQVTFSRLEQTVTTTYIGGVLTAAIQGALTLGALVGDLLVERGGNNPGTTYIVTAVSDAQVQATLFSGTPSAQASVLLELGPAPILSPWDMVRINDGPNAADYYVKSVLGLDVLLQSNLPLPTDVTTGQALTFTVSAGREYLVLSSKKTDTTSSIKVRGTARVNFFGTGDPAYLGQAGTTTYFQLPQTVLGLGEGDLLQFYGVTYAAPSQTCTVTAVEETILTLDQPIASNVSWVFGPNAVVPFARLHTGHVFNFSAFQEQLQNWAAKPEQQASYFTDLNRLINPLLSNSAPSAAQVGDATTKLTALYKELTTAAMTAFGGTAGQELETILRGYAEAQQPAVDALIRSFKDKGADRAVDLLLSGHFQAFFGLTQDTATYAGNMQKAMRDVVLNDLPMKKKSRKDVATSRLLASTNSPDPDNNFGDTETAVPDPVGQGDFG